jgi:hypothetical protein
MRPNGLHARAGSSRGGFAAHGTAMASTLAALAGEVRHEEHRKLLQVRVQHAHLKVSNRQLRHGAERTRPPDASRANAAALSAAPIDAARTSRRRRRRVPDSLGMTSRFWTTGRVSL